MDGQTADERTDVTVMDERAAVTCSSVYIGVVDHLGACWRGTFDVG